MMFLFQFFGSASYGERAHSHTSSSDFIMLNVSNSKYSIYHWHDSPNKSNKQIHFRFLSSFKSNKMEYVIINAKCCRSQRKWRCLFKVEQYNVYTVCNGYVRMFVLPLFRLQFKNPTCFIQCFLIIYSFMFHLMSRQIIIQISKASFGGVARFFGENNWINRLTHKCRKWLQKLLHNTGIWGNLIAFSRNRNIANQIFEQTFFVRPN